MSTATAIEVPEALRTSAPTYMKGWTILAPMTAMADRIAAAPAAAARGVLSSAAYVSLLRAAASGEETGEALAAQAWHLRLALRLPTGDAPCAAQEHPRGTIGQPS